MNVKIYNIYYRDVNVKISEKDVWKIQNIYMSKCCKVLKWDLNSKDEFGVLAEDLWQDWCNCTPVCSLTCVLALLIYYQSLDNSCMY